MNIRGSIYLILTFSTLQQIFAEFLNEEQKKHLNPETGEYSVSNNENIPNKYMFWIKAHNGVELICHGFRNFGTWYTRTYVMTADGRQQEIRDVDAPITVTSRTGLNYTIVFSQILTECAHILRQIQSERAHPSEYMPSETMQIVQYTTPRPPYKPLTPTPSRPPIRQPTHSIITTTPRRIATQEYTTPDDRVTETFTSPPESLTSKFTTIPADYSTTTKLELTRTTKITTHDSLTSPTVPSTTILFPSRPQTQPENTEITDYTTPSSPSDNNTPPTAIHTSTTWTTPETLTDAESYYTERTPPGYTSPELPETQTDIPTSKQTETTSKYLPPLIPNFQQTQTISKSRLPSIPTFQQTETTSKSEPPSISTFRQTETTLKYLPPSTPTFKQTETTSKSEPPTVSTFRQTETPSKYVPPLIPSSQHTQTTSKSEPPSISTFRRTETPDRNTQTTRSPFFKSTIPAGTTLNIPTCIPDIPPSIDFGSHFTKHDDEQGPDAPFLISLENCKCTCPNTRQIPRSVLKGKGF